jgi:hypothetical protein
MNKITAREIQVFVAGALATWGFGLLIGIPSTIFNTWHLGWIAGSISLTHGLLGVLTLWLGGAIFFGKTQAIPLTRIYLWLNLILNVCAIGMVLMAAVYASKRPEFVEIFVSGIIECAVLLWLISLSRSPRFQDKSSAEISN